MLKRLRLLREESGLTQKALAERLGVSQQSINKYENHNIEPDIASLIAMADCFDVSVDYLIGRSEERPLAQVCTNAPRSAEEQALLRDYRSLQPRQKACIRVVIDTMMQ